MFNKVKDELTARADESEDAPIIPILFAELQNNKQTNQVIIILKPTSNV